MRDTVLDTNDDSHRAPRLLLVAGAFLFLAAVTGAVFAVFSFLREDAAPTDLPDLRQPARSFVVWKTEAEPGQEYILRESHQNVELNAFNSRGLAEDFGFGQRKVSFLWLFVVNRREDFFGMFEPLEFDPAEDSVTLTLRAAGAVDSLPAGTLTSGAGSPRAKLYASLFTSPARVPGGRMRRVLLAFPGEFPAGDIRSAVLHRAGTDFELTRLALSATEFEALFQKRSRRE